MRRLATSVAGLLFCLFALLAWAGPGGGADGLVPIPTLAARVTDLTGTLSAGQKAALEQKLAAFEARKGAQVVVLMLPSTQPETIEPFGIRLLDAWKVGRKGVDDGVILIVARDDRRLRIEVGYGLEGRLNDATAKRIISETITPRFKAGDLPGGIDAGVDAILKVVEGEELPAPAPAARSAAPQGVAGVSEGLLFGILIAIVVVGTVLRRLLGNFLGSAVVGGVTGGIGWLLLGGVAGIVIGVLAGILLARFGLDLVLGVMAGRGGWGGGGFGGGGGFRGGGGSGGGGGASGSW